MILAALFRHNVHLFISANLQFTHWHSSVVVNGYCFSEMFVVVCHLVYWSSSELHLVSTVSSVITICQCHVNIYFSSASFIILYCCYDLILKCSVPCLYESDSRNH